MHDWLVDGPWPPAAVATVVAAALALLGTASGIVWAVLRWRRELDHDRFADEWSRGCWAVEMSCAADAERRAIGRDAAAAMYEVHRTGRRSDLVLMVVLELVMEGGDDGVRRQ